MFRSTFSVGGAAAAILLAGPAFAQGHGGGHGGGMSGPAASPMTAPTTVNTTTTTGTGVQTNVNANVNANSQATIHSQGPLHASPNGIMHASPNSVLARGAVSSSTLPGLTTGLTVNNSSGTSIGTVSQVITGTDGSIRAVIVTSPTGQTFRLPPSSLSISGSVVTTTSTTVGG